jgi:cytochrome c553
MKHMLLTTAGIVALIAMVGIAHAADAGAGKAKAAACAGCHGANGEGSGTNPALAGKPEAELVQAMKDYKSGKRNNAMMKGMVTPLSDADMGNLGAYYASLKK